MLPEIISPLNYLKKVEKTMRILGGSLETQENPAYIVLGNPVAEQTTINHENPLVNVVLVKMTDIYIPVYLHAGARLRGLSVIMDA